jgi:hypothetical protein
MIKIGFVSYVDNTSEIIIKDDNMALEVTVKCILTDEQNETLEKMLGMCGYIEAECD